MRAEVGNAFRKLAGSWAFPAIIILAGVLLRLASAFFLGLDRIVFTEASNMAVAFAETGQLADSYRPGQGPSAHLLPLPILWAGAVYRLLGVHSFAAELVLATSAILAVAASHLFLYLAFGVMGMPRPARPAGLAALALVPFNLQLEVIFFRIRESAFGVALAWGALWLLLRAEQAQTIG